MIIKRLNIKNFGKIHDKSLEFSPGINVLYGENESGKTTVHTFIKSMLYGVQRQRGKAARNDAYATYEPWENPAVYGGTMWFEKGGRSFRLTRNFYKTAPSGEFLCDSDGELLDLEKGNLEQVLGEVSEAVYDNTVSVAQLKSVTGQDLVRELQNYMASYQGTGDSSIDLGRAGQMLKMSRKGYQVQADRRKKEIEKEQEAISANMDYLRREVRELREQQSQVQEKEKSLHMVPGTDGEAILDERIRGVQRKRFRLSAVFAAAVILLVTAAVALTMHAQPVYFIIGSCVLAVAAATAGVLFQLGCARELAKRRKTKARWLAAQEKLKWNKENLEGTVEEKLTALSNLQEEFQECEQEIYLPTAEDMEIEALNLAMDTIARLSGNINHQVGGRLRQRTSRILSEITSGKYEEVLMDEEFRMTVNTGERAVPLERLSRGTMEQIYFSLRMAAGELLCGAERFPVILDDVFGMYDEDRLSAVLRWLHKEKRQVVISTCHKRELQLLEKEGIPYQLLEL